MSKNCQLGKKLPMGLRRGDKKVQGSGCSFRERAGVSVQVSGVSKQRTGDRKQMADKVLHHPVFTICLLVPDT
jgi:hypothetical protein